MAFLITFLDKNYTIDEFASLKKSEIPKWAWPSRKFLKSWIKGKTEFTQRTSGSTGKAKEIYIQKSHMMASAHNTIEALKLTDQTRALICINTTYIGGKMMLVRAILGNWHVHLVKPKSKLVKESLWNHYDFAAMVPLQVANTLKSDDGAQTLSIFEQVIIGGALVSDTLINRLQKVDCQFYSTFGMTETVSHIALKRLNGKNPHEDFRLIGDNQISTNSNGCMLTKGAVTDGEWIETNDMIVITENGFKWLGRYDLTVNSGGIKIPIEQTELAINKLINAEGHQFILWKKEDPELGEKLIGICDSKVLIKYLIENREQFASNLPPYHYPKNWFLVAEIKLTNSGKIDRKRTSQESLEEISFE